MSNNNNKFNYDNDNNNRAYYLRVSRANLTRINFNCKLVRSCGNFIYDSSYGYCIHINFMISCS